MLAEGAGTSVSREEAAPLVAEAERLYADALGEVSDQLGLEHPRTLALKVSSTLLASRCECATTVCAPLTSASKSILHMSNAGGAGGLAPQSASIPGCPAALRVLMSIDDGGMGSILAPAAFGKHLSPRKAARDLSEAPVFFNVCQGLPPHKEPDGKRKSLVDRKQQQLHRVKKRF